MTSTYVPVPTPVPTTRCTTTRTLMCSLSCSMSANTGQWDTLANANGQFCQIGHPRWLPFYQKRPHSGMAIGLLITGPVPDMLIGPSGPINSMSLWLITKKPGELVVNTTVGKTTVGNTPLLGIHHCW